MFREFFNGGGLFVLPIIAMALFIAIFLTVILRVLQRSRQAEYRRMASLPLDDDNHSGDNNQPKEIKQ